MVAIPVINIPLRTDEHGTIRIGKTRIALEVIIAAYQRGDTPQDIIEGFPSLTLAEVYAVIAYYLNDPEAVDTYIQQQDEKAAELRREIETQHPEILSLQDDLRKRLKKT